jgi:fumarate reductase subunit D
MDCRLLLVDLILPFQWFSAHQAKKLVRAITNSVLSKLIWTLDVVHDMFLL